MGTRYALLTIALAAVGVAVPASAQNQMEISWGDASRGTAEVFLGLKIAHPSIAIEGFSAAIDFDGTRTEVLSIDTVATALAGKTQFFMPHIDATEHWCTIGAVMDLQTYGPLPAAAEHACARLRLGVLATALAGAAPVEFAIEGHTPNGFVIRNVLSHDGQDVLPDDLISGGVRVHPNPITNLACTFDDTAGAARITWTNGEVYDQIRILRDGTSIAVLSGTAVEYDDAEFPFGSVSYSVVPTRVGLTPMGTAPSCSLGILGFQRGDADQSGVVSLTDAVKIVQVLFVPGTVVPPCLDAMDANDDGGLSISDTVYVLLYLFLSGDAFPAPMSVCGIDPTSDALGCTEFAPCE
ncbi:MAG: hypothetical protein JXP34_17950 [Planctomycetes bacterium]|nr:hypothetical protein [Planctomycetota bacterium]